MIKLLAALSVVSLLSSVHALEVTFAGYDLDNPAWVTKPKAEQAPYGGYASRGWLFFGKDAPFDGFLDAGTRLEKLPAFIAGVTAHPTAQVAQLEAYAPIEDPRKDGTLLKSGTLTLSTVSEVDAITIKVGKNPPPAFQIGLLIDNLESPSYVTASVKLGGRDSEAPEVMTTGGAGMANGKPDWYFWQIKNPAENDEIVIKLKPQNDIATLGGLVFSSSEDAPPSRQVGQFSREGEYMKDYFVFKEGDTFHLFYNVGDAGKTQDWQDPRNEKAFGHATSKDLVTWETHERILTAIPGTWEGQVVSAPSVLKHGDTYYMIYTGFDDRVSGKQAIGLATSKDLYKWERYAGNPVYEAPEWTKRNPSGWLDCRDAHIIRYRDEFLMFTMVTTDKDQGSISLASSPDAKVWKDLGPAVLTFHTPESPRVFEHRSMYYMFASSSHGKILLKTKDPKSNQWEEIPFRWPSPGLWSGWEVVQDGARTIFSAFEWKMDGNYIRFWEVDWDGETPVVHY